MLLRIWRNERVQESAYEDQDWGEGGEGGSQQETPRIGEGDGEGEGEVSRAT